MNSITERVLRNGCFPTNASSRVKINQTFCFGPCVQHRTLNPKSIQNLEYPDELQRALQHLAHRYLKLYCTVCLQFHQI